MHMSDALVSPAIGGVMWAASAVLIAYSSKKVKDDLDEKKIPLMGVAGAFIFAAQMINFSIPGTGSSGHLGGGMILSILLGPYAALITIASVLFVQALFFADGGLLALGCNIFNLGFFPAFFAYPFVYRIVAGNSKSISTFRITLGAILSSIVALQAGAFGVVVQTVLSGVSSLPFRPFLFLMQPIHCAIGLVEGIVTSLVILFVLKARPDIFQEEAQSKNQSLKSYRKLIFISLCVTALVGGVLSWYASAKPDGLEWAISKAEQKTNGATVQSKTHSSFAEMQEKLSFLPDYDYKESDTELPRKSGTSISGIIGSAITLILVLLCGAGIRLLVRKTKRARPQ